MIRVRITRTTNAGHAGVFGIGELHVLPDAAAHALIARGRAEPVLDLP